MLYYTLMLKIMSKKGKWSLENIGNNLDYTETSVFGEEYKSNGVFCGSNRPHITGIKGREFFANVTMKNDKIVRVS